VSDETAKLPERSEQENEQQAELFPEYAAPDFSDTAVWVRVETPELIRLGRGNDEGRELLRGRVVVSYRRRTPTDGTAEVVREQPKSTLRDIPETVEWRHWGEPGPRVDPRVARNDDVSPSNPFSLGRNVRALRWWQREGEQ
jgi:hypothetical protein